MTIDEAISHALKVAEKNDGEAEVYDLLAKNHNNPYEKLTASRFHADCAECAAEHRQLAEWLTELKDLREENKVLMQECDRLIKEKGELLSKVSVGDTLRICQLEEIVKRYESENYKLTQELEQLGTDFNNQVSLVGWHEEQEEEYKRLLGKAMKALNDGSCNKDCRQCKWDGSCEMSCRFAWRYADEALKLLGETNDEP